MRFPVTAKQLIDESWQVRCIGTVAGEVTVVAKTRQEALDKATNEIRYRLEWCPCSAVSDEFVELDVQDAPPSRWQGSVF
jgi:hypothetical protein